MGLVPVHGPKNTRGCPGERLRKGEPTIARKAEGFSPCTVCCWQLVHRRLLRWDLAERYQLAPSQRCRNTTGPVTVHPSLTIAECPWDTVVVVCSFKYHTTALLVRLNREGHLTKALQQPCYCCIPSCLKRVLSLGFGRKNKVPSECCTELQRYEQHHYAIKLDDGGGGGGGGGVTHSIL